MIHKLLVGARAGIYLPFALARLRALERIDPQGWFTQKFETAGHSIEVRHTPNAQYVRILERGSFYFEFATSASPIVSGPVTQEGVTFDMYQGCVVGVGVQVQGAGITTIPTILGQARSLTGGDDVSAVHRSYQVDLLSEPAAYPQPAGNTYPHALYESWAPANPHTGAHVRDTQCPAHFFIDPSTDQNQVFPTFNAGSTAAHDVRDILLDVPFQKNNARDPLTTAYIRGAADWPRANGLQLVTDATWGTREFAIYVDTFNQFSIFPTAQITPIDPLSPYLQNVAEMYVTRITPTLPVWVWQAGAKFKDTYAASPSTFYDNNLVDSPEMDWKFNHLGTRVASIVYEREPYTNDVAYWATDQSGTPFTPTKFTNMVKQMGVMQGRLGFAVDPGHNDQRYFTAPGVVECTVVITLTGPNPEDYSVVITPNEVRRPTTSVRCPLLVGYVWYDNAIASAGTFVTVDAEQWATTTTGDAEVILSVRDLNTDAELLSFPGMPILAADLSTLSFALRVQKTVINLASTTDRYHHMFGVGLVTFGVLNEILYPSTMSAPDQATLAATMAVSGRQFVTNLIAGDANYAFVPLNTALNGFAGTGFAQYRDWWGHDNGYKATAIAQPANGADIHRQTAGLWRAQGSDAVDTGQGTEHLWLCTVPKWGWHLYSGLLSQLVWASPYTTFYVHPLGTYAFWNNAWIYKPTMPLGYNDFDVSTLEHVIFDRVRLQRTSGGVTSKRDTTFLELYNAAVAAGVAAGTLSAGISTMAPADLRAVFTKSLYIPQPDMHDGEQWLNLKAVWDGASFWHQDFLVQSATSGSSGRTFNTPGQGTILGLNFDRPWDSVELPSSYSTGVYPQATHHTRFANPLMLAA